MRKRHNSRNKKRVRNITRYTYEKTAFQGWRVSFCRNLRQFTKYFPDRKYGGEDEAFAAALELRTRMYDELVAAPDDVEAIFARYR